MKSCGYRLLITPDIRALPDGRKLILRKGEAWKDDYLHKLIFPLLRDAAPEEAEPVSSSVNSKVWKTGGRSQLSIKLFVSRGIRDRLFFRKSRSLRAAESSLLLIEKGFLSPVLIVQGELITRHRRTKDFLLTDWVEGSTDIHSYIRHEFGKSSSPEAVLEKRDFIRAFGNEIGRLHREGIFHGDLRLGNILVAGSAGKPVFYFLDNERNRYFPGGMPEYYRLKNLVQINMIISPHITFMDRLRFIRIYLLQNPELAPAARDLILRVHVNTKKRLSDKFPGIWDKSS